MTNGTVPAMTATTAYLITLALILGGRALYQLGYIHGTRRRDERIARHQAQHRVQTPPSTNIEVW